MLDITLGNTELIVRMTVKLQTICLVTVNKNEAQQTKHRQTTFFFYPLYLLHLYCFRIVGLLLPDRYVNPFLSYESMCCFCSSRVDGS